MFHPAGGENSGASLAGSVMRNGISDEVAELIERYEGHVGVGVRRTADHQTFSAGSTPELHPGPVRMGGGTMGAR